MDREWTHGPVVAGSFYPADAGELRRKIDEMLAEADVPDIEGTLRGLVVPHAGYVYSGKVAATAYSIIGSGRHDRVVLIGPSHFLRFGGLATLDASWWRTPLGTVPVEACGEVATARRDAFAREHCLEVQLPFLQTLLADVPVVPLLTGMVDDAHVTEILDELVDESTLLIVSTDLSHYEDYETAKRLDRATADAVVAGEVAGLPVTSACGLIGLQAGVELAGRRGWSIELLDARSSGDTAGPRNRVVGYGAFALVESR